MYGWEMLYANIKDGFLGGFLQHFSAGSLSCCASIVAASDELIVRFLWYSAEAIVRGHRAGLLTVADYNNLCQCETMDDIKLNLVRGAAEALGCCVH